MKKILIICDSMEEKGGVERLVALQSSLFSKDYQVNLLTRYSFDVAGFSLDEKCQHSSFEWVFRTSPLSKLYVFLKFILWLRKRIIDYSPDVIFTHGLNISVLSSIASPAVFRSKIIPCDHNSFHIGKRFWKMMRSVCYRHVGKIISLTNEDLPNYQKINDSVCIHNPICIDVPVRSQMKKNKRVLAVGRLTQQKGFDLLIDAWVKVNREHPDWRLDIVGAGEDEVLLNSLIEGYGLSDKITISPATASIDTYYSNVNLFVLSSRHEGLPLVLLEVMAFGIPAIAFQCKTGPLDVLKSGGVLVEPGNVESLASEIMDFIKNPEDWDLLSQQAMRESKRFSVAKYHHKHSVVIEQVLADERR